MSTLKERLVLLKQQKQQSQQKATQNNVISDSQLTQQQQKFLDEYNTLPDDPIVLFNKIASLCDMNKIQYTNVDLDHETQLQDLQHNSFQTETDKRTLRIQRLPRNTMSDQLKQFITDLMFEVESVSISAYGRSLFALVTFRDEQTALAALDKLQGQVFQGEKILVDVKVTYIKTMK